MRRVHRTLTAALFTATLLATTLTVGLGCKDGELADNEDDHPQIVSVRIIEGETERDTEAPGQQILAIESVTGPENSCRTGTTAITVKGFALAIYMMVPNTQEELNIDAFLTLVAHNGNFPADPAQIVTVSRPTVIYNQPGSARGLIRALARIEFSEVGNFSGGTTLCDGSGPVFYDYSVQAVVLDREFRGDSATFPLELVDNTANFCKASTDLCP